VRHDESGNSHDRIGQAAWVARHVLQKHIPLTLFVLIFGEGWCKRVRQFGRDLGPLSFKPRSDCASQPVVVEKKRLAEQSNIIKILYSGLRRQGLQRSAKCYILRNRDR